MPDKLPTQTLLSQNPLFNNKHKPLVMETRCKEILENIFKRPFTKCRPSFLYNPETGKNLELDGYNSSLKLAFEYNGSQHYFYNPYYHKSKEDFENQKKRDVLKQQLCEKNGIKLIVIPYDLRTNELDDFIVKELNQVIH